jgi:hypothetical protein
LVPNRSPSLRTTLTAERHLAEGQLLNLFLEEQILNKGRGAKQAEATIFVSSKNMTLRGFDFMTICVRVQHASPSAEFDFIYFSVMNLLHLNIALRIQYLWD